MAGNVIQSNYLVSVEVKRLQQLQELAETLRGVRALADGKQLSLKIKVDDTEVDRSITSIKKKLADAGLPGGLGGRVGGSSGGGGRTKAAEDLTRAIIELTSTIKTMRRRGGGGGGGGGGGSRSPIESVVDSVGSAVDQETAWTSAQARKVADLKRKMDARERATANIMNAVYDLVRPNARRQASGTLAIRTKGVKGMEGFVKAIETLDERQAKDRKALDDLEKAVYQAPAGSERGPAVSTASSGRSRGSVRRRGNTLVPAVDTASMAAQMADIGEMVREHLIEPISTLLKRIPQAGPARERARSRQRAEEAAADVLDTSTGGAVDHAARLREIRKNKRNKKRGPFDNRADRQIEDEKFLRELYVKEGSTFEYRRDAARRGRIALPGSDLGLAWERGHGQGERTGANALRASLEARLARIQQRLGRDPQVELTGTIGKIRTRYPGIREEYLGKLREGVEGAREKAREALRTLFANEGLGPKQRKRGKNRILDELGADVRGVVDSALSGTAVSDADRAKIARGLANTGARPYLQSDRRKDEARSRRLEEQITNLREQDKAIRSGVQDGLELTPGLARTLQRQLREGVQLLKPLAGASGSLSAEGRNLRPGEQAEIDAFFKRNPLLAQSYRAPGTGAASVTQTFNALSGAYDVLRKGGRAANLLGIRGQGVTQIPFSDARRAELEKEIASLESELAGAKNKTVRQGLEQRLERVTGHYARGFDYGFRGQTEFRSGPGGYDFSSPGHLEREESRARAAVANASTSRERQEAQRRLDRILARRAAPTATESVRATAAAGGGGAPPPPPGGGGGGPDGPWNGHERYMRWLSTLNLDPLVGYFTKMAEQSSLISQHLRGVKDVLVPFTKPAAARALNEEARKARQERERKDREAKTKAFNANEDNRSLGLAGQVGAGIAPVSYGALRREARRQLVSIFRSQASLQKLQYQLQSDQSLGLDTHGTANQIGLVSRRLLAGYGQAQDTILALSQHPDAKADPRFGVVRQNLADIAGTAKERARLTRLASRVADLDIDAQSTVKDKREYAIRSRGYLLKNAGVDSGAALQAQIKQLESQEASHTQQLRRNTIAVLENIRAEEKRRGILSQLGDAFKRLGVYTAASFFIYNIANSIRAVTAEAIRLESAFVRIQAITGTGPSGRRAVQSAAFAAAQRYGVDLQSVAATQQVFAQAGYDVRKTGLATSAALGAEVGAGLEANQAQELLIAVDALTNGAVNFENIIDRISRVESTRAVSAQDLAVATQRVGSIAQQLEPEKLGRLDFNDLVIGATTAIVERTRVTGNAAATSLRFILSRLAAPEVGNQLQQKFGIKLGGNSPTELRPLLDILSDISAEYKRRVSTGDTVGAAQLLQTVGGARQLNATAALFSDFDDVLAVARQSATAYGDTQRRVALQMETLAAKIEQAKASFGSFTLALLEKTGILELAKISTSSAGGVARLGANSPGLTIAALALGARGVGAGLQFARQSLVNRSSVIGGYEATAVGSGVAGGVAQAAGLATKIAPFLKALTGIGLFLAATQGAAYLIGRNARQREAYGISDIDYARLRNTDQYRQYEDRATSLNLSTNELQARVNTAVEAARRTVGGQFTDPNYKPTEQDRGVYAKLRAAYVEAFVNSTPEILKIADASERARVALEALSESIKFTGVVADARAGELQQQADSGQNDLLTALLQAQRKPTGSALGQLAGSIVDPFGTKTAFGVRGYNATQIGSTLERLTKVGENPIGFTKYLSTLSLLDAATGRTVDAFEETAKVMREGSLTLGQALDQITVKYLTTTGPQDEIVRNLTSALARPGESEELTQRRVAAFLSPNGTRAFSGTINGRPVAYSAAELQAIGRVRANQRAFDNSVGRAFDEIYDPQARRNRGLNELGQNTSDSYGGAQFTTLLTNSLARVVRGRVDRLRGQLSPAERTQLNNFASALENPAFRPRIAAALASSEGRLYIQDRTITGLANYAAQRQRLEATETNLSRVGLGVGRLGISRQRQQLLETTVSEFSGIRGEIQRDITTLAGQLLRSQVVSDSVRSAIAANGEEGGSIENTATLRRIQNSIATAGGAAVAQQLDALDPEAKQRLEARLRAARGALEYVASDQSLVAGLKPEDLTDINTVLQADTSTPQGFAAASLSLNRVLDILVQSAGAVAKINYELDKQLATLQEQLRTQEQLSTIAREQVAGDFEARVTLARSFGGPGGGLNQSLALAAFNAQSRELAAGRAYDNAVEVARSSGLNDIETQQKIDAARLTLNSSLQVSDAQAEKERRDIYRNFIVEAASQVNQATLQGIGSATSGFKNLFSSYNALTQKGGGVQALEGFANAFTSQVSEAFVNGVVGPNGLLGEQMRQIFSTGAVLEAQMIYNAHVQGILAGFAQTGQLPLGSVGDATVGGGFNSSGGLTTGQKFKNLGNAALLMGGYLGGAALGTAVGGSKQGANLGAGLGTAVGSLLGPVGGFAGGIIGGVLGGLFGSKPKPRTEFQVLERIDRNTRETITAIKNQTNQLLNLDNRLLNVPSGFNVPGYRPLGVGAGLTQQVQVVINVDGGADPRATAKAVKLALQEELRAQGSYAGMR